MLQDTFLFADSVLENIRFTGALDATDDECIQAAVLAADADHFIRQLPGVPEPLSERASNLSQGQRQLALAISRAILANRAS